MPLTPGQVRSILLVAEPILNRGGHRILGVAGLDNDIGVVLVETPLGPLPIEVPVKAVWLVDGPQMDVLETHIRHALRSFEGEAGRGFNSSGRGALEIGSRGYSANDGWV